MLDDFLTLVSAGQVEIDVGPRLVPGRIGALLGKEALEEETHPDRIDRRDAQRVTDRAVGGRAAALGEDAVLLAEQDDVVDDEEVPGEAELRDQRQLPLELLDRFRPARARRATVAVARADHGPMPQLAVERFGVEELRFGQLVAEVVERERAALGDLARGRDGVGQIAEQRGHLPRRADVALGIAREQPAGFIERGFQADAAERVEERLSLRAGVADAAPGDRPQAPRAGGIDAAAVFALFLGIEVALHFRVEPVGSEVLGEKHQFLRRAFAERDEPLAEFGELRRLDAAFFFRGGFLVSERQEAAEVLVAAAVFTQERDAAAALDVELGADQRADALAAGAGVEARRAVETADVGDAERGVAGGGCGGGEVFGEGGGAQEGKGRAGV